jgi:ABC-type cobalamin transport system ATPase subunit
MPRKKSFDPQAFQHAVMVIARMTAKQIVKAQIIASGQKVAEYSARDIALLAEAYMAQHREELIAKAVSDCLTFPEFARWRSEIDVTSVNKVMRNRTLPSEASDNHRTTQQ